MTKVTHYNTVAEIIASTVAVVRGANIHSVVSNFNDSTAKLVTKALMKVSGDLVVTNQKEGIISL